MRSRTGGPIRKVGLRRWRTVPVAVAGAVLLTVSQATAPAAFAAPAAQPGQASAQSSLFSVAVRSGGTPLLPSTVGSASASYVDTETQASSATLDLGGLGFLLSAIPVCGITLLPTSRQPQPLSADSATGSASETTPGNVGGAGTESVSVARSPESATATTKPVSLSLLGGVLDLSGKATSTVRYGPGGAQQSDSAVTENLSLGSGLVQIDGMHWSATRRSGSSPTDSATFSFGQVLINKMGLPLALPSGASAAAVVSAINAVVAPIGLHLTLPSSQTDKATGVTAIGPLQVHFAGSALDSGLVTPAAQQISALQQVISGQSANGSDCSQLKNLIGNLSNPAETVDNIVLGIAQGAGGVDLNFGGASASTQAAIAYANPFADNGSVSADNPLGNVTGLAQTTTGQTPGLAGGEGAAPLAAGSASSLAGATTARPPSTASPPGSSPGSTSAVPGSAREVSARCVSTSPAGGPACSSGLGETVGAATLGAAAVFSSADVAYSRRARRRRRARRSVA